MQLNSHIKLCFTRSPPSLIMAARTPSMPRPLPRFSRFMQEHSSTKLMSSCKRAYAESWVDTPGTASHSGTGRGSAPIKALKASKCTLGSTGQAVLSLEKPPELARILSSHLTQLLIAPAHPGLLHPTGQRLFFLCATSCCAIVLCGLLNIDSI